MNSPAPSPHPAAPPAETPRVLRSEEVLGGARVVEILHGGVRYRLSVTAAGKLILTK